LHSKMFIPSTNTKRETSIPLVRKPRRGKKRFIMGRGRGGRTVSAGKGRMEMKIVRGAVRPVFQAGKIREAGKPERSA